MGQRKSNWADCLLYLVIGTLATLPLAFFVGWVARGYWHLITKGWNWWV